MIAPDPSGPVMTEHRPKENLGEGVYRILWERILDRRLRPGAKLSDLRISTELGVSRTPVREALLRLVQDGVVRAERNRGFAVAAFSAVDVTEIYDLRAILETGALRLALPMIDRDLFASILADHDTAEVRVRAAADRVAESSAAEYFLEIDRAFHRSLIRAAGNHRLTNTAEGLWAQIAVFQTAGAYVPDRVLTVLGHHRAIITALLSGDDERAMELLHTHINDAKGYAIHDLANPDEAGV